VLDKLPKRLQADAKSLLREIMNAPSRKAAEEGVARFSVEYASHKAAVTCLTDDTEELLAFFAFPADHWKHLRTTNPIESTFSTTRLRTRVTKGAGSRAAGLAMTFKLLLVAQETWRRIDGHEFVPLVRAGARFVDGKPVEREDHAAALATDSKLPEPEITSKPRRRNAA